MPKIRQSQKLLHKKASGGASAAQFFAFFAKTKDGRAKNSSRKMTCEKFAKNCPKIAKI